MRREEKQRDQSGERKRRRVKNAGARMCVQYEGSNRLDLPA